jgi:enamine deaminase RidA (YjgF/YER057c/UK114 family)
LPFRINGNTLVLAGVISIRDGIMTHAGQVGRDQTVDSGYAAAQVCALNALASIKAALGRLDRVREFLFVSGYVNAVAGFGRSPEVINGASDLFVKVYGDRGRHARGDRRSGAAAQFLCGDPGYVAFQVTSGVGRSPGHQSTGAMVKGARLISTDGLRAPGRLGAGPALDGAVSCRAFAPWRSRPMGSG